MTAADVIVECGRLGVELTAAADGLRVRAPAGVLDAGLRERLRAQKPAILAALLAAPCPSCKRPLDAKRRCWWCHYRPCDYCGRPTGTAFISTCLPCDLKGAAG